jgi:CheY-like chemotaxis protein
MEASMPADQEEHWDRTATPQLTTEVKVQGSVSAEMAAHSPNGVLVTEVAPIRQFRFRILVVDDEPPIRELALRTLESRGYEVLTAADGLDGLHALGRSLPDLIISDLNMPRMSGFEFLAVVRRRFPHIATIAVSGENVASENPPRILADAILQKGSYALNELCNEIVRLLAASPIRTEAMKSEIVPLFVQRDQAGRLIITCPKCLRSNTVEAMSMNGGLHETICQSCPRQ